MRAFAWWGLLCFGVLSVEAAGVRALTEAEVRGVEQAIPALPAGLSEAEVMRRLGLDPIRQLATATSVGGKTPDFTTTYTLGAAGHLAVTQRGEPVVRVEFSRRAGAAPTAVWPDRATRPAAPRPLVVSSAVASAEQLRRDADVRPEVGASATPAEKRRARALKYLEGMVQRLKTNFGLALITSVLTAFFLKLAIRVTAGASVGLARCYLLSLEMCLLTTLLTGTLLGALMFTPLDGLPGLVVAVGIGLLVSIGAPAGVLSRVPDEQTGLPIGWWRGLLTFLSYAAILAAPIFGVGACVRYLASP
jgi:hypothetical protein